MCQRVWKDEYDFYRDMLFLGVGVLSVVFVCFVSEVSEGKPVSFVEPVRFAMNVLSICGRILMFYVLFVIKFIGCRIQESLFLLEQMLKEC